MTYRDTFVGCLKDAGFDWSDPGAELSREDIQFLTDSLMDDRIFYLVVDRSKTSPSRYLDWGSVALRTTKKEILALMRDWVVGDHLPGPGDQDHRPKQSRATSLTVVKALPGQGPYVLVTEEF